MNDKIFQPLGDWVVLEVINEQENLYKVLSCPKVTIDIKIGDLVIFDRTRVVKFINQYSSWIFVRQDDICVRCDWK